MSRKEEHNSLEKYLKADRFSEYCKANNVEASLGILEAYEKVGLLYPIYRLVLPDDYIRELFEHNHQESLNPNLPFDVDGKWRVIEDLKVALSHYQWKPSPCFALALKHGHPLDCAHLKCHPFLQKPFKENYKPWEEYKVTVGTFNGHPMKIVTADHYYAPWQIFVLDELYEMHVIEENYATGWKKGWGIIRREFIPSKVLELSDLFQTTTNFRMMESLIWHDITFDIKSSVIEGEPFEQLNTRRIELEKSEFNKHQYEDWIRFIRKLVELYKHYTEREKIKLSNELKRFLTSAINMIIDATQKSFEELSNDYDGRFKGSRSLCRDDDVFIYPGELFRIYPDELQQIKERAGWVLISYVKQFSATLPDNEDIENRIKDSLIDSIVGSGHDLLLSHLYEIEYLWSNRRPHWEGSIWAHLRSLAISIESLGHEWCQQKYLGNILEHFFGKEYTNLRNSIGNKITDANTLEEYKQKLAMILEHKRVSAEGICGHHLLVAHLTRNYFSHWNKYEPDMLGSLFLGVYKDLVLTLISLFVQKTDRGTI